MPRCPGLTDGSQRERRVIVVGPTTLFAILNSLQMRLRTLTIEKLSSELSGALGAVKFEFGEFGSVFQQVEKKLVEASKTVDDAGVRTKAMERTLRTVDELTAPDAAVILGLKLPPVEEAAVARTPSPQRRRPRGGRRRVRIAPTRRRAGDRGISITIRRITNPSSQHGRTAPLEGELGRGRLKFSRQHVTLMQQPRGFPLAKYDDGPDALEMANDHVGMGEVCRISTWRAGYPREMPWLSARDRFRRRICGLRPD